MAEAGRRFKGTCGGDGEGLERGESELEGLLRSGGGTKDGTGSGLFADGKSRSNGIKELEGGVRRWQLGRMHVRLFVVVKMSSENCRPAKEGEQRGKRNEMVSMD